MTPTPSNDPRGEAGFTLIEMLVAMVLSVIVLLAILTTFDSFSRNAARQTRRTDANGQVRGAMDRIVADLRQARTIEVADAADLVYTVADSATAYRRERICMDSSGYVWRSSVTTTTAPSPAIASGTACPTTAIGAYKLSTMKSANTTTATNPIFRYDTATAANVRSVGITIALNAGNVNHTDITTLRASAFRRSKSEAAPTVTDGDITTTCSSSGVPTLTLSSSVGSYGVRYTDIDGTPVDGNPATPTGSGTALTLTGAGNTVIANITSSTGIVSQLVKVLAC